MKKFLSLPFLALTACGPLPDDYAGNVASFNGNFVQIEAMLTITEGGPRPTAAMIETASALCGSRAARFVGTTEKDDGSRTIYGPFGSTYVAGSDPLPLAYYNFACIQ